MKRQFSLAARTLVVGCAALAASTLSLAQSNSPWLPIPGGGSIGLNYVNQTGDSAFIGDKQVPISGVTMGGAQDYKRQSYGLKLSYGVVDAVSVDASFGRGEVKVGAADSSSGATDSVIGVNWRVLDEYESRKFPTVTLRLAAIANGGYDGARLAALGKAASGYELGVSVGRQLGSVSVWGGLGIEKRSNGVPDATVFDINGAYSITPKLAVSLGYTQKKFDGSLDIGDPGFSGAAFQKVKEQRETVRAGVSYAIAGNQTIALNLGKLVGGRNTVKDDSIVGLGYSFGF